MYPVMRHAVLFVLAMLLAGCVSHTDDGTQVVIRYEYWVPLLEFAGGVAAVVAGLAITWRVRWLLILGGLLAIVWLTPTSALTRVWLTADGLHIRNGIWGMTASADLKFDNIAGVREFTKQVRGSRGALQDQRNLRFQLVGGGVIDAPIANDVMQEAANAIFQRLAAKKSAS